MRIVKHIGLLFLSLCCATTAVAQRDANFDTELSVGVRGGVSIPDVAFSPNIEQNPWVGYTTGFVFRYTEEKIFGLIAELNFTRHGWNEMFEENEPYSYCRALDYVEIPFMVHLYFGSENFHAFLNLGPQVGFLINDSYTANFDIDNLPDFAGKNRINEVYKMPAAHKIDYGITGGLGVELRMKRHILLLEGRYYFGLGDIFGNHKSDVFYGSSANRGFLVSLAYLFRIW